MTTKLKDAYVTAAEAAKIFSVSRVTILNWGKAGKIKFHDAGGVSRGKTNKIPMGEIVRLANELDIKTQLSDVVKPNENGAPESEDSQKSKPPKDGEQEGIDPEREIIIGNRRILRPEAERIIKQEDAIKRQIDNLTREGKLIEVDVITDLLSDYYAGLVETWEELIDLWITRHQLTQEQGERMLREFKSALDKTWRTIKRKAKIDGSGKGKSIEASTSPAQGFTVSGLAPVGTNNELH